MDCNLKLRTQMQYDDDDERMIFNVA